ncbi:hypothetical protein FDG95_gp137 [Pectobacterium phage vB_PcaM_CBB]|uniref:Uncharacterized protein n=1 Tax=Pectobacterium phage vB_PcaM_CBB TaxID=2772511 RepID=A0A1L2CUK2_9CAUD|nr:hypothetical protein FDG95_gp137 [Pectobacterium phage vB_PcaM_CBB]AMM43702.1 hypothetical protein CBB_137 [Pectobacterium phage vB_PcaM_CBB]
MLNQNQIDEIINRYPHETVAFISDYLGISRTTVQRIANNMNLVRLHLNSRNPSIEFLASYYSIDISVLKEIEKMAVYRKPFPGTLPDALKKTLWRKFGKPMTEHQWNSISELTLDDIRHIMIYFPSLTNSALAKDLKIDRSLVLKVGKLYDLEKLPREEMFCDKCRVEHLPPREYKSGNVCKKCWTERMSEYQYIYYPAKQEEKRNAK